MARKNSGILKLYFLLVFITFSISVFSQSPQIPEGILPPGVDIKNLTPSQLSILMKDKNAEAGKDLNQQLVQPELQQKDTLKKDSSISKNRYDINSTFGENIFRNSAVTNLSELSSPPPDYPIGVGDNIIVSLWGAAEYQQSYVVARDGSIFPEGLGKINVQGLTFDEAKQVITSRFRRVVPGGTKISVAMGLPRTINVNVVGEVNIPGPLTVSAFANGFNVVAMAGGVTPYGNLRSIIIKRNGQIIDSLDVYKYLTSGDFGKRTYLLNNDFVIVGFVEKKVLATGQFKRPMYYQLRKNEGIKALIKYSGGFTPEALLSAISVVRVENEKQIIRNIDVQKILNGSLPDYILEDGDVVRANLINPEIKNQVEIKGEVNYPGAYEIKPGDKIFDIINKAGGLTKDSYLNRAFVFRSLTDSGGLNTQKFEVDLSGINKDFISSPNNILISPDDVIQIFSKAEFGEEQFVEIFGEVRKQGPYKKYDKMTLLDLLYMAGGIKQSAQFGRLEISSIVDIDSAQRGLKPTRTIVRSFAVLPDLQLDSIAGKILLKPFDQVFVRKNPTFELQENVELRGLVNFPGKYPRLNKFETLSSFIERAGGLKDNANVSGAVLLRNKTNYFREKLFGQKIRDAEGNVLRDSISRAKVNLDEPVSIDLEKALQFKGSKYDIVLQENDIIVIPEKNPFISIEGTVQSPLKIAFDKDHTNLMYYVDKAGGFGIRPWRKRIYVTYANGKSKRTKSIFFIRMYPKVEEGSVITVPVRPQGSELSDIAKSTLIAAVPVILTAIIFKYIK